MSATTLLQVEKERQQEDKALLKRLHRPIRKWYRTNADLKKKYGKFPLFWQDLKGWEHWETVRKAYMIETEDASREANDDSTNIVSETKDEIKVDNSAIDYAAAAVAAAKAAAQAMKAKELSKTDEDSANVESTNDNSEGPEKRDKPEGEVGGEDENAKKRRRKSRWGGGDKTKKRKSRWNKTAAEKAIEKEEEIQRILTENKDKIADLRRQFEDICDKLLTVVEDAKKEAEDPNRPPSPLPTYDSNGIRTNNRETRMRKALEAKRIRILQEAIKLNPRLTSIEKPNLVRKLYIPEKEFPGYNFIGLIIGPRGNTHRKMEAESGCKLAIRGRGSIKEGKSGRQNAKPSEDDNDDLHVNIQGKDEAMVDLAEQMIAELLVPVDEDTNEHKQKQLRELALINGTLRAEEYCTICGEKGHRSFECPNRHSNVQMANVVCKICGESSHITADCPVAKKGQTAEMDAEYLSLMSELGEAGPIPVNPKPVEPVTAKPDTKTTDAANPDAESSSATDTKPTAEPAKTPATVPVQAPMATPSVPQYAAAPMHMPPAPMGAPIGMHGMNPWNQMPPMGMAPQPWVQPHMAPPMGYNPVYPPQTMPMWGAPPNPPLPPHQTHQAQPPLPPS